MFVALASEAAKRNHKPNLRSIRRKREATFMKANGNAGKNISMFRLNRDPLEKSMEKCFAVCII